MDDDFEFSEEDEVADCPSCGDTYDDADADFLICSKCGYDAEKKNFDHRRIDKSMKGYGIDSDVTHRVNRNI